MDCAVCATGRDDLNAPLEKLCSAIDGELFATLYGRVQRVRRDSLRTYIPHAKVGSLCYAESSLGPIPLEIVSLDPSGHVAMPLDDLGPVRLNDRVTLAEESSSILAGEALLGQVVDSMCIPYEGKFSKPLLRSGPALWREYQSDAKSRHKRAPRLGRS